MILTHLVMFSFFQSVGGGGVSVLDFQAGVGFNRGLQVGINRGGA